MTAIAQPLPRWRMETVYPSLESPEFEAAFRGVVEELGRLERLFEERSVRRLEASADPDAVAAAFDEVAPAYNRLLDEVRTVSAYLTSFVATNSRNDAAQARQSELQGELVRLRKLGTRLTAWLGSLDVGALEERSETAREHAYTIERARVAARHQMDPPEEDLASSLSVTGSTAWAKLHGNLTSRLAVTVALPGGERTMPMSAVRGLARHADAGVREAAYRAELEAWPTLAVPLAAALNSIKGEVNALSERRGWESPLAASLFGAAIDADTLAAMHGACVASFADFRRYFRTKARLLGRENGLRWYDLFAPVGRASRRWEYPEATEFIARQFGTYSSRLEGFARRAFAEGWVDAEPRDGKRDGAFCMGVRGDESRVMMNYEPSLDSVSTLAHELGHAYHNLCDAGRTALQRQRPMTLAETASIFCETVVMNAALDKAAPEERLSILENDIQGQAQVVVDIHSRFLFESRVFEGRKRRELSVDELCDLMTGAQRETYGEFPEGGLEPGSLHPYMWAVKGHYYSGGLSFYNYPYTFGLLFGLGLYARYRQDPEVFKAGYDDLLSRTGMADAATLAAGFGINTRDEGFWAGSLDLVRERIGELEVLAG